MGFLLSVRLEGVKPSVYDGRVGITSPKESVVIVEQIWTANNWRNFNYLVVCPETGEALAIDPLDHIKCLKKAQDNGWEITQILNTHEHPDHTGGNGAMIAATGAQLLAHENAFPALMWVWWRATELPWVEVSSWKHWIRQDTR